MEIKRTFDILEAGKDTYENRTVIAVKKNGVWDEYTIERYSQMAHNLSYGLLSMGLRPGDKVANISGNRPEWNIVDMGITQAGMVHVPIYPTISTDEYKYILKHAEVRAIFVGDKALYQKLQPLTADLENFIGIFSTVENGDIRSWNEVLERGKQTAHEWVEELFKIKASVQPDDIATIIYTSGTTGVSKGVMLSHSNFLSNVEACKGLFPLENGDIAVSFLPLSHVFERMVNYYYQSIGVTIYYADNLATIGDVIKEVKPHIFIDRKSVV